MLYVIRGISGSGKTTLAKMLVGALGADHFEADQFFETPDGYKYDGSKIDEAHKQCLIKVKDGLFFGRNVVVSNTFTRMWELQPYLDVAKELHVPVNIIRMENDFGSVHGTPEDVIQRMKDRMEDFSHG